MSAERVEIPLRMLRGNLEALLDNRIPCQSIGLCRDEDSSEGVILIITATPEQKAVWPEFGFTTQKVVTTPKPKGAND